jgi:putative peptidoglycan binding protein
MDPVGLLLLALAGAAGAAPSSPSSRTKLPGGTPPWPQTLPPDLPPFGSAAWEYDEPPPAAVQARAKQLVGPLWQQGQGSTRTEQTAGRWITYRAEIVASGNQGIVAYRLKAPKPPPRLPKTTSEPQASRTRPKPAKPAAGRRRAPKVTKSPGQPVAQNQPAPAATTLPNVEVLPAIIDPIQLPELKIGAGLKPKPPDPNVALVQQKLTEHGIPTTADGRFGKDTQTAVIAFQVQHELAPAEPVEQLRARGFGAVKLATWKALLEKRA